MKIVKSEQRKMTQEPQKVNERESEVNTNNMATYADIAGTSRNFGGTMTVCKTGIYS